MHRKGGRAAKLKAVNGEAAFQGEVEVYADRSFDPSEYESRIMSHPCRLASSDEID